MPVVLHGFEEAFGTELIEGYGLSETSPVASSGHPGQVRKPGSIGTPIEKVEMRIVDENDKEVPTGEVGEIVIRGHNIMKGYWDGRRRPPRRSATTVPRATSAAKTRTASSSSSTARKDMIIRGGYNV